MPRSCRRNMAPLIIRHGPQGIPGDGPIERRLGAGSVLARECREHAACFATCASPRYRKGSMISPRPSGKLPRPSRILILTVGGPSLITFWPQPKERHDVSEYDTTHDQRRTAAIRIPRSPHRLQCNGAGGLRHFRGLFSCEPSGARLMIHAGVGATAYKRDIRYGLNTSDGRRPRVQSLLQHGWR